MTNTNTPGGVTACIAYRSNEAVVRRAKEIALEHACAVHVGRFVDEDTGERSPTFFLDPPPVVGGRLLACVTEKVKEALAAYGS